ncbi:MAG: hypothetical protein WKF75_03855 [Singulisphaera sp.]
MARKSGKNTDEQGGTGWASAKIKLEVFQILCGMAAGVIATAGAGYTWLSQRDATIEFSVPEDSLSGFTSFRVVNLNSDKPVFSDSLAGLPRELRLDPGPYRFELRRFDQVTYKEERTLRPGQLQIFSLPGDDLNTIAVDAQINTMTPASEILHLRIRSSGNGYLWVYGVTDAAANLLELTGSREPLAVTGGKELSIPSTANAREIFAVAAGVKPGDYRLLVLVTTSRERADADAAANAILGRPVKTGVRPVTEWENWGFAFVHYKVG